MTSRAFEIIFGTTLVTSSLIAFVEHLRYHNGICLCMQLHASQEETCNGRSAERDQTPGSARRTQP